MRATVEKRLEALEARTESRDRPLLILRQIVAPGVPFDPIGTTAHAPHLPELDRAPGEAWDAFVARLEATVAYLPSSTVVRVVTRHVV